MDKIKIFKINDFSHIRKRQYSFKQTKSKNVILSRTWSKKNEQGVKKFSKIRNYVEIPSVSVQFDKIWSDHKKKKNLSKFII